MSIDQRIVKATEQLEKDVKLTYDIVNGNDNTEVMTAGGLVPTHAKVAKDSNLKIIGLLQPAVNNINQHAAHVTAEADRSTAQANISTSKANTATTQANEAKAARDEAVAIVHSDEGSLVPTAGAYPVADGNGHLNIGWTPLLQAMYPYSGVIRSVDKSDIFAFKQTSDFANRIQIRYRAFNINGRLVNTQPKTFVLPEAESTAERAIAFDDIFLDGDGHIQTYRSITPHRTSTGYDRDAIAEEHGYSRVQTGLYKMESTYALLLGRVARRNKGAYHPVFNPEGANVWRVKNSNTAVPWASAHIDSDYIFSKSTAFNYIPASSPVEGAADSGGNIGAVSWRGLGRPDDKPYDAIYADDFTPLYYSAKNVVDRQALLFDSFNRAVAGETFMGAEGSVVSEKDILNSKRYDEVLTSKSTNTVITADSIIFDKAPTNAQTVLPKFTLQAGTVIEYSFTASGVGAADLWTVLRNWDGTTTTIAPYGKDGFNSVKYTLTKATKEFIPFYIGGKSPTGRLEITDLSIKFSKKEYAAARPQFLMVDIIGSLDAMPDEWKTHGLPGNWLAVGEEGESLIPDGTEKSFKLSRKCLECYQVLTTDNKGQSWADVTSSIKPHLESASNSRENTYQPQHCLMVFYRTSANPFELADSMTSISQPSHGMVTNNNSKRYSMLMNTLLGKVITGSGDSGTVFPINNIKFYRDDSGRVIIFDKQSHERPDHSLSTDSFGCKALPYLSMSPVLYMHCYYKELKHNGESWGDDNKFDIVDKQSTVTDLNGETVIVGQKRIELPYHFDGETY